MSAEHLGMVFAAQGINGTAKLLLLAYCNYTDPHGYCWPGEERLAAMCGTSVRTVARAKATLTEMGLIRSMRRVNRTTGEPISNLTRVNLPKLASMVEGRSYDDNAMERIAFPASSDTEEGEHPHGYLPDRQEEAVNLAAQPCQAGSQSLSHPAEPPLAPVPAPAPKPRKRDDVEALCAALADSIAAAGYPRPAITRGWRADAAALLGLDGVSLDDARAAIRWSQEDSFWAPTIINPGKLRKHYTALMRRARASRGTLHAAARRDERSIDEEMDRRVPQLEHRMGRSLSHREIMMMRDRLAKTASRGE